MNSIDRHRLALQHMEADRVPVAPSFLTRTVKLAGIRQYDYHTDPEVLANAQINHCDHYDFDGLYISSDNVIMYEALGGKIFFPDDHSYPFWSDPLLAGSQDLTKLTVPDPCRAGRMPVILEAARLAAQKAGDRRFILANIDSGPFNLALILLGMQPGMTFLVDRPEEMKAILAFCAEVTIAYGTEMAKTGCHAIQFGEASASLIGRKHYAEMVWPYDCYVIEALKKKGVYVFLHVCGNSTPIFDLMVDSGADCLEFDSQVDIGWAKARAKKKVALKGNINTTSFLSMSPEQMGQDCDRIIKAAKPGGGFILCGGCEVPADAPEDVIWAVRHSVDRSGSYLQENSSVRRQEK